MKQKKSGDGVKVAKVIEEVQSIINDATLSYLQKCKLLCEIETDKRPGKKIAEDLIISFTKKKREYKTLNQRIKDNRKSKSWEERFMQRTKDEGYTPTKQFYISDVSELKSIIFPFLPDIERFADQLKKSQKEIILRLREKAKEEKERIQKFVDFEKETGLDRSFFNNERNIFEVQENKASNAYKAAKIYARFGDYYITVTQYETTDWKVYSKAWHNTYGPKRTIESRNVNFYKNGKLESSIYVNSFAGNYIIYAIIRKFNLQKIKVSKELKKVQLIDQADVVLIRQILNTKIYKRTLAGIDFDFCAVHNNETFHAATISKAIAGLQSKIKAEKYFEREIISKSDGFKLGFCEIGMKSFCDDNNLNYEGEYSRKELRNIVILNRSVNCEKYASELKKLGIILNCK